MTSKQAACDPCRKSKLACGHERPVCARCQLGNKASTCVYRASPFKRRRSERRGGLARQTEIQNTQHQSPALQNSSSIRGRNPYPNPGFLGPSSHTAIFDRILSEQISSEQSRSRDSLPPSPSISVSPTVEHPLTKEGARLSRQLFSSYDLKALNELVIFWRANDINLAVAEPFVDLCANSSNYMLHSDIQSSEWHLKFSAQLSQNSTKPLEFNSESTISTYASQFLGNQTRWETFGIFLSAVTRATRDIHFFPSLYTTWSQKLKLRRLLTKLIDCSLDICLSIDCLHDLQLVLQYERFIIHSYVDGDQSYCYWRALGDLITSIFALGYHENTRSKPETPCFLLELRKTIFARAYSADKNVSIFLGRPPRMSKRFCRFQIPQCPPRDGYSVLEGEQLDYEWPQDARLSYRAETRWSALCASVKEEIMELQFDHDLPDSTRRASALQATADAHWNALPFHFRFEGSLKNSNNTPFERDFLISIRLNYLHITFMLQRSLQHQMSEPHPAIIEAAQEILHLVVEAILLREELVNSGTGLDWKIAYYGLPSAGILLLAILRQQRDSDCPPMSRSKALQDLTILANEVHRGTVVRPEEPNYELLSKAVQTIHRFLDCMYSEERSGRITHEQLPSQFDEHWLAQWENDHLDFDIDFWQGFGHHSPLLNLDGHTSDLIPGRRN